MSGFMGFPQEDADLFRERPFLVSMSSISDFKGWFEENGGKVLEHRSDEFNTLRDLVTILRGPLLAPGYCGDSIDALLDIVPDVVEAKPPPTLLLIRDYPSIVARSLHLSMELVYYGMMVSDELALGNQQLSIFFCLD